MTLFTPLGLLGLLAIAVLILIYIIRPNYQQKRISSTYVWKLSLRYKKKRIPISKLRNILLIVCQVLILTSCAVILSQPNLILKEKVDLTEVVAIIDSSASMRASFEDETRFERAVKGVLNDFNGKLPQNGVISVVVADPKPYFLIERMLASESDQFASTLQTLLNDDEACSFGSADLEGAVSLCEGILKANPAAQIYLYTDTQYSYTPKGITVKPVRHENEWNAAILNAHAEFEENYYAFYVEVACYGRDTEISLNMEVQNANAANSSTEGQNIAFREFVQCSQDETKTVIFKYYPEGEEPPLVGDDSDIIYHIIEAPDRVYSYQSVHLWLEGEDSFAEDNTFDIYGGQKEVLKVQYASNQATSFFNGILFVLQSAYKGIWDIQIDEVKDGNFALSGFDFYIFENAMPPEIPKDGIVYLVNPSSTPANAGFRVDGFRNLGQSVYLAQTESHPILQDLVVDDLAAMAIYKLSNIDPSYDQLATVANDVALMVKDEEESKVVVMTFGSQFSNITISPEFPLLIFNMFEYFLPATVKANSFEVFEQIALQARGSELTANREVGPEETEFNETFDSFPATMTTSLPGTYLLSQITFSGKTVEEKIYIKIPAVESNIRKSEDRLDVPEPPVDDTDYFLDLLLYIAAALVAILFLEWWLHSREQA